jgi:hypothetical protein
MSYAAEMSALSQSYPGPIISKVKKLIYEAAERGEQGVSIDLYEDLGLKYIPSWFENEGFTIAERDDGETILVTW